MSVTIYDVHMEGDVEIDVAEFWDACNKGERAELRELVVDEFDIVLESSKTTAECVTNHVGSLAEGIEAADLIRRTCEELEWQLRNRDFS